MSINIAGLLSLLFVCSVCFAQTPVTDSTASISGRVTIGGTGTGGISVVARLADSPVEIRTVAKTVTDDEGNYQLTGLSKGLYTITPIAKAFLVGGSGNYRQPGQTVNVVPNDSITKIDFALMRGGVITGRVTDLEGRPIIGEPINVTGKADSGDPSAISNFMQGRNQTDDRGVYRIYGLAPGSYTVSVGRAASTGSHTTAFGTGGSQYTKTFYPGVTDVSKATAIEISEGIEVGNIDITPGKTARGFSVSGRVIDADSNQPVANAFIAYTLVDETSRSAGGMNFTGSVSDASGKFRVEGLEPGHYSVFTMSIGKESSYSDSTPFYITSGDVTGIEIKVRRGATIEGVAVIENNVDPAAATLLQSVSLFAFVFDPTRTSPPSFARAKIDPDGSFQFTGLAPGKANIQLTGFPESPRGLELTRTEHQGQVQLGGIEVTAGARVTGVRLVFTYGTGKVVGEVKTAGGPLPDGTPVMLTIGAVGEASNPRTHVINVDSRGRFIAENLPPGSYELRLRSTAQVPEFEPMVKTVTVTNGVEVPVTIIVELLTVEPE